MNDFFEILNYCAFDVDKASKMADGYCTTEVIKEALDEIGLERMESKSHGSPCGGLCHPCRCESSCR